MAFGSEKTSGRLVALMVLVAALGLAQQDFAVMHQRALWPDRAGTLQVTAQGLRFTPAAKKPEEAKALELTWNDVQQLTLSERALEVVTYRDVLWQFGRDKQFRFVLPEGAEGGFASLAEAVREAVGGRAVIALGGEAAGPVWRIPAKRTGLLRGAEGTLALAGDELRFDSAKAGESRRWPLEQIQTVAQTGPYALQVTVPERDLADMGGYRNFQFSLKQPLTAEQFQDLWRKVERAHGTRLRFRDTQ